MTYGYSIEPSNLAARWPDRPALLHDDELDVFRDALADGLIFTNRGLPSFTSYYMAREAKAKDDRSISAYPSEIATVWPLFGVALKLRGAPPESFTERVGVLWEWRDQRRGETVLDGLTVPVFTTVRFLSREQHDMVTTTPRRTRRP